MNKIYKFEEFFDYKWNMWKYKENYNFVKSYNDLKIKYTGKWELINESI